MNIHDERRLNPMTNRMQNSITRGNRKFLKHFTLFFSFCRHFDPFVFFFFFFVQSIGTCTIHKLVRDLITSCFGVSSHYVLHNETDNLMKRQVRAAANFNKQRLLLCALSLVAWVVLTKQIESRQPCFLLDLF